MDRRKAVSRERLQRCGTHEILTASGVPKGSLYHHFPNGKTDLALEAAALAHREMSRIIDDSFQDARDFKDGATTLFHKLAKLFDLMGHHTGCPISSTLFGGPNDETFRTQSAMYFDDWINQIAKHAIRLGEDKDAAHHHAQQLFLVLQGGWTLARSKRNSDILRGLKAYL